jgi:uncharacterized membrane protein
MAKRFSSTVALFDTHRAAEVELRALRRDGSSELSIVEADRDEDDQELRYYTADDRMKSWARHGALWGALAGIVFGDTLLFVPNVGASATVEPFIDALLVLLEGAFVGALLAFVAAAFVSLGVPGDRLVRHRREATSGKFAIVRRSLE